MTALHVKLQEGQGLCKVSARLYSVTGTVGVCITLGSFKFSRICIHTYIYTCIDHASQQPFASWSSCSCVLSQLVNANLRQENHLIQRAVGKSTPSNLNLSCRDCAQDSIFPPSDLQGIPRPAVGGSRGHELRALLGPYCPGA